MYVCVCVYMYAYSMEGGAVLLPHNASNASNAASSRQKSVAGVAGGDSGAGVGGGERSRSGGEGGGAGDEGRRRQLAGLFEGLCFWHLHLWAALVALVVLGGGGRHALLPPQVLPEALAHLPPQVCLPQYYICVLMLLQYVCFHASAMYASSCTAVYVS
jgi:hypothetical protein